MNYSELKGIHRGKTQLPFVSIKMIPSKINLSLEMRKQNAQNLLI